MSTHGYLFKTPSNTSKILVFTSTSPLPSSPSTSTSPQDKMTSSSASTSSLLECPICQQSLLTTTSTSLFSAASDSDNAASDNSMDDQSLRHRTVTSSPSTRWSPICTPCGHLFHKCCITEWFRTRRHYEAASNCIRCTCPTCRKLIAYHKLIRVYLPNSELTSVPSRISVSEAVRRYNEHNSVSGQQVRLSAVSSSNPIYNDFFTICGGNGGYEGGSRHSSNNGGRLNRRDHSINSEADTAEGARSRHRSVLTSRPFIPVASASASVSSGVSSIASTSMRRSSVNNGPCENEDCVALRNVYEILSREFQTQQRKLELEMDVSSMKSIIVAGLQRDIDQLRKAKSRSVPWSRVLWILLVAFIMFWISATTCLVLYEVI